MNKNEGKKERRKRTGKKERIKKYENKKTGLEHKRPTVSLHHVPMTNHHHLCLWGCTLRSTNSDSVTKAGAFQFLEATSEL
jgi:hypothetical protein